MTIYKSINTQADSQAQRMVGCLVGCVSQKIMPQEAELSFVKYLTRIKKRGNSDKTNLATNAVSQCFCIILGIWGIFEYIRVYLGIFQFGYIFGYIWVYSKILPQLKDFVTRLWPS